MKSLEGQIDDRDARSIFIKNVEYACKESQLEELFGQFGEIKRITILRDPKSQRSKGAFLIQDMHIWNMSLWSLLKLQNLQIIPSFQVARYKSKTSVITFPTKENNHFDQDLIETSYNFRGFFEFVNKKNQTS